MIKCIKCYDVSGIKKSGVIRNKQRYFCNHCKIHFLVDKNSSETIKPHTPTIKDIAASLGFSVSTVSKALHDHSDVSVEKKAKILQKASELDYRPNKLAIGLKQQKTMTIGLVVPEFTQSFYPKIILNINEELSKAGYTVVITQAANRYGNEVTNVNTLLANKVDGIIAAVTLETNDISHLQKIIDLGVPLVLFGRYSGKLNCPKIKVNDFLGAYHAVKHLVDQGYRKIGHLGGPEYITVSTDRYAGYVQALTDHNLAINPEWIIQKPDIIPNAKQYALHMLGQKDRPDAIFAFTDPVAIAVIELAETLKLKIPDDLGLVGFSDDPISKYITPGITTMLQPIAQMAEIIVSNLLMLIKKGYSQIQYPETVVDAQLIERASSIKKPHLQTKTC